MSRKNKMTLQEAINKFPVQYSVIEELAGIPKGSMAQYTHRNSKRTPTEQRLKEIEKGLRNLGRELKNIELIPNKNEQSGII